VNPEDYPPQEPISDFARPYHEETMRRAEGLEGIEAVHGEDPYQSVVLFPAPDPSGDVLAFIHGGAWTNGYKEWMSFMAPALTQRGVTFASLGYRLAPMHLFPSGFDDCADGIKWLCNNVNEHGGDPNRLFVGGHSAGGHYSALLAVTRAWRRDRDLPEDVVGGCLPISGVFDFRDGGGMSTRPRFLGPADSDNDAKASPIANIDGTPPPFLLTWGEKDFPHLIEQAEHMQGALADAGGDVETLVIDEQDHLGASLAAGDEHEDWIDRAVDWMRAHQAGIG